MTPSAARFEAAALLLGAVLLGLTLLPAGWAADRRAAATGRAAEAVLRALGERQSLRLDTLGRYAAFGASPGERDAALPGPDLGPAADLFHLEAWEDESGAFRLRAVTRADAIRRGDAAPLLQEVELPRR